jgi:hypothetical protein
MQNSACVCACVRVLCVCARVRALSVSRVCALVTYKRAPHTRALGVRKDTSGTLGSHLHLVLMVIEVLRAHLTLLLHAEINHLRTTI